MAVLGSGGRLELRREAPSPCVILPEDIGLGSDTFEIHCEGYWPGDRVTISGPNGLPIFINGVPQCWDCVASYRQDVYFVAANRTQIANDDDQFYKSASEEYVAGEAGTDNNAPKTETAWFYYRGETADAEEPSGDIDGYLCIDALGRAKLYRTKCEGMQCCGEALFSFVNNGAKLDFDFIVVNPYGSAEYQNAVTACFGEIGEYIFNDVAENNGTPDPNRNIDSICNDPPNYLKPPAGVNEFDNADIQPRGRNAMPHPLWTVLCEIKNWTLNLDAPSVDTTGVGEKFGNSVKSVVSGGGSAEFFIDKKCYRDGVDNGTYLMRLLLMTQMNGCKAQAKFYMITDDNTTDCGVDCDNGIAGGMWYETEILVVQNAINLRPDELIAGTANFVTTGEIKLQIAED